MSNFKHFDLKCIPLDDIHHINHFFKTNSHLCNSRHEIWRGLALLKLRSLLNFLILGLKNNLVVDMILNLSLILSVLLFFTVCDNYPSMIYRCNHTDVILIQEKLMQINFSSYSILVWKNQTNQFICWSTFFL